MKSLSDCLLYTFIDTAYLRGRGLQAVAEALCVGGSDLIQLRAKTSNASEVESLARAVLPILRAHNVGLVVNDHWLVAVEVKADACHLGQEDFFGKYLRKPRRKATLLGLSSHKPQEALRAVAADADYIAIGPVFPTPTKPERDPVTLSYVRWARENVTVPWFAIGGINLRNLGSVLAAGATRVCVVSAILEQTDLADACHRFKERLTSAAASRKS